MAPLGGFTKMEKVVKVFLLLFIITAFSSSYANESEQIGFVTMKAHCNKTNTGTVYGDCIYEYGALLCNKLSDASDLSMVFFKQSSLDLYSDGNETLSFSFYEKDFSCRVGFDKKSLKISASLYREIGFN